MAIQGPISVEFGKVFPGGAYAAGPVEKVRDFERSRKTPQGLTCQIGLVRACLR